MKLLFLTAAAVSFGFCTVPTSAADMSRFDATCPNGGAFLLGQGPENADNAKVLAVLCPCLSAGFRNFSQPEVDALEADLRTGTPDEAKATYPAYGDLQAKASEVLNACMSDVVASGVMPLR